jgi:hypothetical protein
MKIVASCALIAVLASAVSDGVRACDTTILHDISELSNLTTGNQIEAEHSLLTTGKIPILGNSVRQVTLANSLLTRGKVPILANSVASARAPSLLSGTTVLSGQRIDFRLPVAEEVARKWTLTAKDPVQTCELDLVRLSTISGGNVVSGFGCPDGFFNVVSWRLDGMELRFLSPTGRVMARFYQTQWGWQGERENDGAVLVLTQVKAALDPRY